VCRFAVLGGEDDEEDEREDRRGVEGKDRLGGGPRAVECCGPGQDTGSIQTRYAPGRSRFRSRRRGCPTLVSGEMPRTSGSGRSIGHTPRSAQLTVERILATRSAVKRLDRRRNSRGQAQATLLRLSRSPAWPCRGCFRQYPSAGRKHVAPRRLRL
jgi:hypothetical protein